MHVMFSAVHETALVQFGMGPLLHVWSSFVTSSHWV